MNQKKRYFYVVFACFVALAVILLCIRSTQAEQRRGTVGIPLGAVVFFTSSDGIGECPPGWSVFEEARGRYIVGLPVGGSVNGIVGTPLKNMENRPVGEHTHEVIDPGHSQYKSMCSEDDAVEDGWNRIGCEWDRRSFYQKQITETGISIQNTGTVPGTNAPYIQLLACRRD